MSSRSIEVDEPNFGSEGQKLLVHRWLEAVKRREEAEFLELHNDAVANGFQVQRDPERERLETETRNAAMISEARRAAKLARERAEDLAGLPDNSGFRTIGDIRPPGTEIEGDLPTIEERSELNQLWPGQTMIDAGESYITREEISSEAKKPFFKLTAAKIALSGLINKTAERMPSIGMPEINFRRYPKIGRVPTRQALGFTKEKYAQAKDWTNDPEKRQKMKKRTLLVGGAVVAMTAALVIEQKVGGLHSSHSAQESATPANPHKIASPGEFSLPLPLHVAVTHAVYHAHKTKEALRGSGAAISVTLKNGYGYTQVLQKAFKGHSPIEYYRAYKEGLRHFGPGFIKHVGHYREANDFGLSGRLGTKVQIPAKEASFFVRFFSSHR